MKPAAALSNCIVQEISCEEVFEDSQFRDILGILKGR